MEWDIGNDPSVAPAGGRRASRAGQRRPTPPDAPDGLLDPVLLRSFLAVAGASSFSQASRLLAIRQSTVSEHVQRLEACVRHRLFDRDTRSVALTREGEALIPFARAILDTGAEAVRHLGGGASERGRQRVGVSGALAGPWLAPVLRSVAGRAPQLTVAGAEALVRRFEAGELDLVLAERWPGDARGEPVAREELVWVGAAPPWDDDGVALVLPSPPSLVATTAVAALERAGVAWHLGCSSDGLAATLAAVEAGLGAAPLPRRLVPPGMALRDDLPAPGSMEIVVLRGSVGPDASALIAAVGAPA